MATVTTRALSTRIWDLRIDSAWRHCEAAFGRLFALLEESETCLKFTAAGAAQSAWLSFADRVASCLVSFLATATDDNRNLPSRFPRSQRTRPDEPDRSMAE